MHIIYLAGNSLRNKDWIEKVKAKFDKFSAGEILYYDHWQTGEKWLNLSTESAKLIEKVKAQKNYFVFAKSIGTVLALKNIFEKKFTPLRAIFCGLPYQMAQESGPVDQYLKLLAIPTIFIQNEFDPVCSFAKLQAALAAHPPAADFKLIKIPGNSTHDYEDFSQLATLAKNFFGVVK